MGVDLRAIFIHHFDESNILNVPDLLNANQSLAVAIRDYSPLFPDTAISPFHWQGYLPNEREGSHSHPSVKDIWDHERIKGINDEGIPVVGWDGSIYFGRQIGRASCSERV